MEALKRNFARPPEKASQMAGLLVGVSVGGCGLVPGWRLSCRLTAAALAPDNVEARGHDNGDPSPLQGIGHVSPDHPTQQHARDNLFVISRGMRIAQMVAAPVMQAVLEPVEALPDTARGDGGFGSTGV